MKTFIKFLDGRFYNLLFSDEQCSYNNPPFSSLGILFSPRKKNHRFVIRPFRSKNSLEMQLVE